MAVAGLDQAPYVTDLEIFRAYVNDCRCSSYIFLYTVCVYIDIRGKIYNYCGLYVGKEGYIIHHYTVYTYRYDG